MGTADLPDYPPRRCVRPTVEHFLAAYPREDRAVSGLDSADMEVLRTVYAGEIPVAVLARAVMRGCVARRAEATLAATAATRQPTPEESAEAQRACSLAAEVMP